MFSKWRHQCLTANDKGGFFHEPIFLDDNHCTEFLKLLAQVPERVAIYPCWRRWGSTDAAMCELGRCTQTLDRDEFWVYRLLLDVSTGQM